MRRVGTTEERTSRCSSRDHGFAGTHFPIGRRQNKHRDCRTPTKTKNRREAKRDSQAEMANRSTVEETLEIIAISSVDKRSMFTRWIYGRGKIKAPFRPRVRFLVILAHGNMLKGIL